VNIETMFLIILSVSIQSTFSIQWFKSVICGLLVSTSIAFCSRASRCHRSYGRLPVFCRTSKSSSVVFV